MGWDSRPWNETPFFWSDNTPQKFRELCRRAKALMDASPGSGPEKRTAIFCCWNEFGEGHYIEPTRGYGFSYLDVIREVFCEGPREHVDVAPEDVGLAAVDSWYCRARESARAHERATLRQTAWSGEEIAAWSAAMGMGQVAAREGVLRATSINGDPAFFSPPLKLRAGRTGKVIVEMRLNRPAGMPTLLVDRDGAATHRSRQRCGPHRGRRPVAHVHLRRGAESALGWMHYLASLRSGHAGRRDRRVEIGPPRIIGEIVFATLDLC